MGSVSILLASLSNFFLIPNLILFLFVITNQIEATPIIVIIQLFLIFGTVEFWILSILTLFKFKPRITGKTIDGDIPMWSWVLFFPYYLYVWGYQSWKVTSPTSRIGTEIENGLFLSGWKYTQNYELHPEDGFHRILDLTCELPRKCQGQKYMCIPVWDGTSASAEELEMGIKFLTQNRNVNNKKRENILIHCANGRGRSALFLVAYLLRTGKFDDVDEAFQFIKEKRRAVKLSNDMRKTLVLWIRKYC